MLPTRLIIFAAGSQSSASAPSYATSQVSGEGLHQPLQNFIILVHFRRVRCGGSNKKLNNVTKISLQIDFDIYILRYSNMIFGAD